MRTLTTREAAKKRESRSQHLDAPIRCRACGQAFQRSRVDAKYCSNRCRSDAFKERAQGGRVASVRRLKSGKMSVVVHLERDTGLVPGQAVRVAGEEA